MIIDRFIGFIATIVDINGEGPNYGKVKIRIVGDQGENAISDDDLLWATPMMPVTSAAFRGIGTSPNWLVKDATVIGIFMDGNYRNIPIILGSVNQDRTVGHGITPYAGGEDIPRTYNDFEKEIGVEQARRPVFKDNKVITTAAKDAPDVINHIIEIDDTQSAERILVKHKNGSYVEFLPNGTVVIKGTEAFKAMGNDATLRAFAKMLLQSDKTMDLIAKTAMSLKADQKITVETQELGIKASTLKIEAQSIDIKASTINMTGNVSLTGNVSMKGQVAVVGAMTLNGRPVATT